MEMLLFKLVNMYMQWKSKLVRQLHWLERNVYLVEKLMKDIFWLFFWKRCQTYDWLQERRQEKSMVS